MKRCRPRTRGHSGFSRAGEHPVQKRLGLLKHRPGVEAGRDGDAGLQVVDDGILVFLIHGGQDHGLEKQRLGLNSFKALLPRGVPRLAHHLQRARRISLLFEREREIDGTAQEDRGVADGPGDFAGFSEAIGGSIDLLQFCAGR